MHTLKITLLYFPHAVNVGEDCPVFDGLFEFCQLSTGGSVGAFVQQSCTFSNNPPPTRTL